MIADIVILTFGFTGGWFANMYRERLLRVRDWIKNVVTEELKK